MALLPQVRWEVVALFGPWRESSAIPGPIDERAGWRSSARRFIGGAGDLSLRGSRDLEVQRPAWRRRPSPRTLHANSAASKFNACECPCWTMSQCPFLARAGRYMDLWIGREGWLVDAVRSCPSGGGGPAGRTGLASSRRRWPLGRSATAPHGGEQLTYATEWERPFAFLGSRPREICGEDNG